MDIHFQITNVNMIPDKSDMAKLPARRRDELQKKISSFVANSKKVLVGTKSIGNIWRLDDDYLMLKAANGNKEVYLSEKRRMAVK